MDKKYDTQQMQFLKNAARNNRIPQALIFEGSNLALQKQVAFEFIKLLGAEKDLIIVSPEKTEITIGQIRELQKQLSYISRFSGYKVVIIKQAEKINKIAQVAFLKTLEEPTGKTIFILMTNFTEMLLKTIKSRCCILKFFQTSPLKINEKDIQQIKQLLNASLAEQFSFAEKISKNSYENIVDFFDKALIYLRNIMIDSLNIDKGVKHKIEVFDSLRFLFLTTNINKRIGLENMFLNL